MAPDRTEKQSAIAPDAAARRRAFAAAAATVLAAAGLMLALGVPGEDNGSAPEPEPERRVVGPGAVTQLPPLERAPDAAELEDVRAAAAGFSRAFLARESGRFDAAVRRQLRASATRWTWRQLRRPVRVTPAWRPPPSRFEEVSGLTETSLPGVVEATVAYRRGGHQLYLSLLISREGGRWCATPRDI
jgi:hypothetical protein